MEDKFQILSLWAGKNIPDELFAGADFGCIKICPSKRNSREWLGTAAVREFTVE